MGYEGDLQRAQIMRQQCSRIFRGKSIHDVVATVQMLTADAVMSIPSITEAQALSGASAIAGDIQNIIRERFATQGKGH
jgi:hypothetical protein